MAAHRPDQRSIDWAPSDCTARPDEGFGTAIERLLETLADRDRFAMRLCHIVGCDGESEGDESSADSAASGGFQECDVLFGKHANREQARIATALDRHGSVLVQGPPGTGKSHTIANLIGHMLAQGRSVLVTSHSTKALRVLRGHLVPELRPLCVTVLESDLESRHQLEESVYAISRRLSESDADTLEREAKWLNEQRQRLLSQIDDLKADLRNVLSDEYRDIVLAGESFSPSDAARRVAQGRGLHDWIPGPVASGEPCRASAH